MSDIKTWWVLLISFAVGLGIAAYNKKKKKRREAEANRVVGTAAFKFLVSETLILLGGWEAIPATKRIIQTWRQDQYTGAGANGVTYISKDFFERDKYFMAAALLHENVHHAEGRYDTTVCSEEGIQQELRANAVAAAFLEKHDRHLWYAKQLRDGDGRHYFGCKKIDS